MRNPCERGRIVAAALAWTASAAVCLGALEASMDIHPRELMLGESARMSIRVRGVRHPPAPALPDLDGFHVESRGREMRTQFIMGQGGTSETAFNYALTPLTEGRFRIGPFSYSADGETATMNAVDLIVTASGRRPDRDVFVRLDPAKTEVYNQEVFEITLSVYASTRLGLSDRMQLGGLPETGLKLDPFREIQGGTQTVDGRPYRVRRYRTTARALTSGSFELRPTLTVHLIQPRERNRRDPFETFFEGSLFDRQRTTPLHLQAEPVVIEVRNLPDAERPGSFRGAVGRFRFDAAVRPLEADEGDPLTVTMTIEGDGNIGAISAPSMPEAPDLRVYDSRLVDEAVNEPQTRGRKVFEQVVIPSDAARTNLPAVSFSYFDPEAGAYRTEIAGPFPVSIADVTNRRVTVAAAPARNGGGPDILGRDIVYLKPAPRDDGPRRFAPPIGRTGFWLPHAIPASILAAAWVVSRRRERLAGDRTLARHSRAFRLARAELDRARDALRSGDGAAFREAVWRTLTLYFSHRLAIGEGDVSAERVCETMRSHGLAPDACEALAHLFARCETARYGGRAGSEDEMRDELQRLRELLRRCEKCTARRGPRRGAALFLAALTCFGFAGVAPGAEDIDVGRLFAAAADAYDAGDLESALTRYRKILDAGRISPELLYNIGNVHARAARPSEAIVFYRRAQILAPRDPDIAANLLFAAEMADAEWDRPPLLLRLFQRMALTEWTALAAAAFWGFCLAASVWRLTRRARVWKRVAIGAALLFAASLAGIGSFRAAGHRHRALFRAGGQPGLDPRAAGRLDPHRAGKPAGMDPARRGGIDFAIAFQP